MFKKLLVISQFIFIFYTSITLPRNYEWAVIGAGPAGITVLSVMLALNIDPSTIIWIDPEFNVGRMGRYYRNVPGNLQTKRLTSYITNCNTFNKFESETRDALFTYDPETFQPLHIIVNPLIDTTNYLRSQVAYLQETVVSISHSGPELTLKCRTNVIHTHKAILAIGSHPKILDYNLAKIDPDEALDKEKLAKKITADDCIAVFGGMHSALLILKYLSELNVKMVINFYSSPYFYGRPGTAGLEGITAEWAKNVLENNPPINLMRIKNTTENISTYLPLCNKVIYAIGYEKNPILIDGNYEYSFDETTGIIAPNVYGIGIAFAPTMTLDNGKKVDLNGFNTYLNYAQELIPIWQIA